MTVADRAPLLAGCPPVAVLDVRCGGPSLAMAEHQQVQGAQVWAGPIHVGRYWLTLSHGSQYMLLP